MLEAETADLENMSEFLEKQQLAQAHESGAQDQEEKEIEELAMKLDAKKALYEENQLKMAKQNDAFDSKMAEILHEIDELEKRNNELERRNDMSMN